MRLRQTAALAAATGALILLPWQPALASPAAQVPTSNQSCLDCHVEEQPRAQGGTVAALAAGDFSSSPHVILECVACHQDKKAQAPGEACQPGSAADRALVADLSSRCAGCHQGVVAESYAASFHGSARRLGDVTVATCVDCHGAHTVNGFRKTERMNTGHVASASEPPLVTRTASRADVALAPATVEEACRACHKDATSAFAVGEEHRLLTDRDAVFPFARWTWKAFLGLLVFDLLFQGTVLLGNACCGLFRRNLQPSPEEGD